MLWPLARPRSEECRLTRRHKDTEKYIIKIIFVSLCENYARFANLPNTCYNLSRFEPQLPMLLQGGRPC